MRKVLNVRLHKTIYVPGFAEFKTTLNPQTHIGLEMFLSDKGEGVQVRYKGYEFIVPWHMAECAVLGPKEETKVAFNAKKAA